MSRPFRFNGHVDDNSNARSSNPLHSQSTHARFTSLTEFPPSDSVRSHETMNPSLEATQLDFKVPPPGNPHEQIFYRDPNSFPNGLDFDDDTTSACGSLSSGNELESDIGDDSSHRISLRGPRIRFHSRAPWETDDILEGDESDDSRRSTPAGVKFKKKTTKADGFMHTFGRGSPIVGRRSVESNYSLTTTSKVPLEFSAAISSRHGFPPSSETLSNLGRPPPPSAIHQNAWHMQAGGCPPSSDHSSPTESSSSTTYHQGEMHTSSPPYDVEVSPSPTDSRRPSEIPSSTRSSRDSVPPANFVHPYANPDLVTPHTSKPRVSPHQTGFASVSRSDSISTVTDSISGKPTLFPTMSREASKNASPKDTPSGHRIRKREISSPTAFFHGSDLNSPYLDRNSNFLSLHPPPLGHMGPVQPHSPPVALISLQEAQARERSRNATVRANAVHSMNADSTPHVYSPDPDDVASIPESQNDPDSGTSSSRSRAQSISVSSRAKTTFHSLVGGSLPQPERRSSEASIFSSGPPAGRVLKPKKSGFMRLFSGRGDGDKIPPPPVPALSDIHLVQDLPTKLSLTTSKLSLSTVSVTQTSPPGLVAASSSATMTSDIGVPSEENQYLALDPKCPGAPRKRLPPPLYISTGSSSPLSHFPNSESRVLSRTLAASSSLSAPNVPQSAPPAGSDFQGLKLRPVSALFSAQFGNFVANPNADAPSDSCVTSPSGTSAVMWSPLTPSSSRPSDGEPHPTVKAVGEQPLTVEALQEQFMAAKKAWQRQILELEGQVRDLQNEIEDLRAANDKEYCEVCQRGNPQKRPETNESQKKLGVLDRPRAHTGDIARFSSANRD
ncbi:hypothetical protein J3A83DRAFT_4528285 [Scleroderma citrinum]